MTFKSIAEFLDPKNGHRPTSAERKLIEKTRAGEPCLLFDPANPSRPTGPSDKTSIRAPLLRLLILGGTKDCGLHESGVWLLGGWIEGKLDLAFCTGKGQTTLTYCHFTDRPALTQTTLPQLSLDNSAFPGLLAQGTQIAGSLFLRSVIATGTVDVNSSKIGGQLACIGASLDGGKDKDGTAMKALNAQGMKVRESLFLRQVTAIGTVDVTGAKIGGPLDCEGATLDGGQDGSGNTLNALNAQGVEIGSSLILDSVTAKGTVHLISAKIGQQFDFEGATLDSGTGKNGTMLYAMNAQGIKVTQGFLFRKLARVQGLVDLTAAHVGDLVDDAASWPDTSDSLILDGFTYDRISGHASTTFAARRDWLAGGSHWQGEFRPQPYTQFARVLRQMGHAGEARQVLMERERLLAKHWLASDRKTFRAAYDGGVMTKGDVGKIWIRMRGAQLWSWLTRWVAGYGYAPQRALYCALAFIGVSFFAYMLFWQLGVMVPTDAVILTSLEWKVAFDASWDAPALIWAKGNGPATSHYETFYSLPYALDVFLPIVDLGQQSTWGQTTVTWTGLAARLWTWGLQIAGYVITSLGLAAATGIIQRNQPD